MGFDEEELYSNLEKLLIRNFIKKITGFIQIYLNIQVKFPDILLELAYFFYFWKLKLSDFHVNASWVLNFYKNFTIEISKKTAKCHKIF